MDEAETGPNKLISELISHINALESRLSSFEEKLDEEENLQLVNRLDVINLRNEIDKVKLVMPSISDEQFDTFRRLLSYLETAEAKSLISSGPPKDIAKDLKLLGQRIASLEQNQIPEGFGREIEKIKTKLISLDSRPTSDTSDLHTLIKQNKNQIDQLRQQLADASRNPRQSQASAKSADTRIKDLEIAISNLKLDVQALARKSLPKSLHKPETQDLKSPLRQLKSDVEKLKRVVKSQPSKDSYSRDLSLVLPVKERVVSLKKELDQLASEITGIKSSLSSDRKSLAVFGDEIKKIKTHQPPQKIRPEVSKNGEVESSITILKRQIFDLQRSSSVQEKRIQSVAGALPQMRKAIDDAQDVALRSAEKTKKETADYILKELRRTFA